MWNYLYCIQSLEESGTDSSPFRCSHPSAYHTDERLQERVLSTGDLPDWMDVLKHTYDDVDWAAEGGESSRTAAARGLALLEECWQRPESHGAVITHGNLLSLMIRHYNPSFGYFEWMKLSNPDVYVLRREREMVTIQRLWRD